MDLITINQSESFFVKTMNRLLFFYSVLICCDSVWGLQRSLQCGAPFSGGKIVGGADSGRYRYPWFALLLLKKNAFLPIPVCAGTLITALHILTAAHCFSITTSVENEDLYSVALGVYDICKNNEATREIFNIDSVVVHEKYNKRGKFYDIALIQLDKPAGYTFICLPIYGVDDITEVALLLGFGVTDENSNFVPCQLLEANVTKFSKKDCSKTNLPLEDKKESSVICAGSLTGEVDSCYVSQQGDSGGPLLTVNSDGRYVLAGIVSYGYGCATPNIPGIYTNVGSYIPWIQDKISSLGLKRTNSTKNRNPQMVINARRRGSTRRPNSGVSFPGQKTTTSTPKDEKLPINLQYFNMKRPTFNHSVFYTERRQKPQWGNSKESSKGNSKVLFPD